MGDGISHNSEVKPTKMTDFIMQKDKAGSKLKNIVFLFVKAVINARVWAK